MSSIISETSAARIQFRQLLWAADNRQNTLGSHFSAVARRLRMMKLIFKRESLGAQKEHTFIAPAFAAAKSALMVTVRDWGAPAVQIRQGIGIFIATVGGAVFFLLRHVTGLGMAMTVAHSLPKGHHAFFPPSVNGRWLDYHSGYIREL